MLNVRSLSDIQMENSGRNWIYKSGVKGEVGAGDFNISLRGVSTQIETMDKMSLPRYMKR